MTLQLQQPDLATPSLAPWALTAAASCCLRTPPLFQLPHFWLLANAVLQQRYPTPSFKAWTKGHLQIGHVSMSAYMCTALPQALRKLLGLWSRPLHVCLPRALHSAGVQKHLVKGILCAGRVKIGSAAPNLQPYRAGADLMAELVFCTSSSSSSS